MAGRGSLYDRLLWDLEHSTKVKQEVSSGRRIGFYRLKSQLGAGNFAQVKLGLHLLTNGERATLHHKRQPCTPRDGAYRIAVMRVCQVYNPSSPRESGCKSNR